MRRARAAPIVHLELHTGDMPGARALYGELCGWRAERIDAGGSGPYLALELGGLGGGFLAAQALSSLSESARPHPDVRPAG